MRCIGSRRFALFVVCATAWSMNMPARAEGLFDSEKREIEVDRRYVSDELVEATRGNQIERGTKRPVLDGLGRVMGIPSRIYFWDRRVDNHDVSPRTEAAIRKYLADNNLDHVKVRINQYAPLDDWQRLQKNESVAWGYRYTFGALSVMGEALLPGRLLGGDYYNPFTATVHIYSDVPTLAIRNAAVAKDYTRRPNPGNYAVVTFIPFVDIWAEEIASADAIAYAKKQGDPELEQESYRFLDPGHELQVAMNNSNFFKRFKSNQAEASPPASLVKPEAASGNDEIPAVALEPLPAVR